MSVEKHVIELTAKDTVSTALKNIGKNATDAGKKAEDAGKKASRSAADWGDATGKVGLALGGLATVAIALGNDSEVAQQRLEQSIENTGAAYADLEEQIGKAADRALDLAFDDEDALNAISKLTDATGDAEKAINDLAIAQDVARGRGISLAAATDLVVAAENERFGALSRVGIKLDENATSEEALALLQEKYAGQAEAYAETSAASYDRIGNSIENNLESLGSFINENAGVAVAIGGIVTAAGPAIDAFKSLNAATNLSSIAMGPVGMVAAGVALIGTLALLYTQQEANTLSTQALTEMMDANTTSILDNAAAWDRLGLLTSAQSVDTAFNMLISSGTEAQATLDNITGGLSELQTEMGNILPVSGFSWIDEADAAWLDSAYGNGDAMLTIDELTAAQNAFNESLRLTADQASAVDTAFDQAMAWARDPNYMGGQILADINAILNNPDLTGDQVVAAFNDIIARQEDYNIIVQRTKAAQDAQIFSSITQNEIWSASVPILDANTQALQNATKASDDLRLSTDGTYNIDIDTTDASTTSGLLATIAAQLAALDGTTATVYVNGRQIGFTEYALGGVTGWGGDAAALGMSGRGNVALVGEAGPELVYLPGGSRVEPNSSSRYKMGSGDGGITINGPITVIANDPQSFVRQLRQSAVTLERR